MSVADPTNFAPHLPSDEVWNIINNMPVKFQDFAEMSYYYSRLYDVLTGAREGGNWDSLTVNECLRTTLWRKLHEVTMDAEARMGYNLSVRYHYQEMPFPQYGKGITNWPGVVALNVRQEWSEIEGYGPFPISAIAESDVEVDNPNAQPIVKVDARVFENPLDVQLRNGTTGNTYLPLTMNGYPKRVGNIWEIPLDTKRSLYDPNAPVAVQHRKHLILDVDAPNAVPEGAVLHPVYPGTNQIIPQARPAYTLENGKTRYTFYIYALVHPAFRHETVDLEKGEFYKLYPAIEIKAVRDVTTQAQVVWTKGGREEAINVTLRPVVGQDGVFHVVLDDEIICDPCALFADMGGCEQDTPETITLRFYYKTDPRQLDTRYSNQIPALRQAICHRVAAELPVMDCGCRVSSGFIFENQRRHDDIQMKPYQGFEVRTSKYTDLYGRLRYEDILTQQLYYSRFALV